MCICKQKSKTPAGSPGNFNYIFSCTDANNNTRDIKISAGNDVEAKMLAEEECSENKISVFQSGKRVPYSDDSEITITAFLEADDNYYYIYPTENLDVFCKVNKANIISITKDSNFSFFGKELKPLHIVCFKSDDIIETSYLGNARHLTNELFANGGGLAKILNMRIDFNADGSGEGIIKFNGKSFPCLGKSGVKYPKDLTFTTADKYRVWHSTEFNVDMEYAIKIWGQRGIFIHLGFDNVEDNEGQSQGCIHVDQPQIIELYNWVTQNTRLLISYPW
ncbi:MAG: murein L,D-transpeptidase [Flavobacterium sp.]|nr:MAG: murein L,D-transpeptidase [Flavobacterium sp.]